MTNCDQMYIAGQWQTARGQAVALINPATEQSAGDLICASPAQVTEAVDAARAAFDAGWGQLDTLSRAEYLRAFVAALEERREELAQCISAEIGTPIDFARAGQVGAAFAHLEATLTALDHLVNDRPLTQFDAHRIRYEPLGVAVLITPWNWPLNQVVLKVGAALAAGCCVVLKPSELSSRTAVILAKVIEAAGLPEGVFNLILGDGAVGAALVEIPQIDIVSFTGSTATGREIAKQAAQHFTRTTLELGGKSPNILFADCDLPTAVRQGVAHCFRNSGQSCNAATRMLVQRDVYDEAVALALEAAEQTYLDAPDHPGGHQGPLVSQSQYERVQRYLQIAKDEGARFAYGGAGRPDGIEVGFYARPTVLADVTPEMTVFKDEIFGPVLCMTPFDTEDEAIALANDSPYGLAGYVQTADEARADRVAQRLRVGMVQVNGKSREGGAPFGGMGQSGSGREAGLWGIRAFQDIKSISGVARNN